jgi:hypothetical protein
MHAVFCYGWWDNPANLDDGYWLCKNRCGHCLSTVNSTRNRAQLRLCRHGMPHAVLITDPLCT